MEWLITFLLVYKLWLLLGLLGIMLFLAFFNDKYVETIVFTPATGDVIEIQVYMRRFSLRYDKKFTAVFSGYQSVNPASQYEITGALCRAHSRERAVGTLQGALTAAIAYGRYKKVPWVSVDFKKRAKRAMRPI